MLEHKQHITTPQLFSSKYMASFCLVVTNVCVCVCVCLFLNTVLQCELYVYVFKADLLVLDAIFPSWSVLPQERLFLPLSTLLIACNSLCRIETSVNFAPSKVAFLLVPSLSRSWLGSYVSQTSWV